MRLRSIVLGLFASAISAGVAWADPVLVRIGVVPVIGAAPLFVADGEHLLKDGGLAPKFTTFESGPAMIQALASGTMDVYVGGVAPLVVAHARGIDVRVVASTAIEGVVFVANPKLAAFFAPGVAPAEAFKRFHAKEGRPAHLATQPPGSVPNAALHHWLWQVSGTAKSDVDLVQLGIDATEQAVLTGAVDGASIHEPALTIVQARDPGIKLIAGGGDLFPHQPGAVVAVTGAFAKAHPEAVQSLVSAVVKATDILQRDPDRAAPDVAAALGKGITEVTVFRKALTSPASKFVVDPRVIVEATTAMQAYQVSMGMLDKAGPLDGLFDAHYYDTAVAK